MEKKMEATVMGCVGATTRIHSFIPSFPKGLGFKGLGFRANKLSWFASNPKYVQFLGLFLLRRRRVLEVCTTKLYAIQVFCL